MVPRSLHYAQSATGWKNKVYEMMFGLFCREKEEEEGRGKRKGRGREGSSHPVMLHAPSYRRRPVPRKKQIERRYLANNAHPAKATIK